MRFSAGSRVSFSEGILGFVLALFGNFILSLVGGVRFATGEAVLKGKKEKREDHHDYGFNFGGKD